MHTGSCAMSDGAGADVDMLCEVQLNALTMGPTHFVSKLKKEKLSS